MKWYVAKMIFKIVSGAGEHKAQFDEQVRLITAENAEQAYKKAAVKGLHEEDSFLNHQQETVKWQYIAVAELEELKELKDGIEIFSRIEDDVDESQYINMVKHKRDMIEMRIAKPLIN